MQHWQVLGLDPTPERRLVKRAYARLLKECSPEDDPAGFQTLRSAYEQVIDYIKHGVSHQHSEGHYVYFDDADDAESPTDEPAVDISIEAVEDTSTPTSADTLDDIPSNVVQLVQNNTELTSPPAANEESSLDAFDSQLTASLEATDPSDSLDTHQQSLMFVQSIISTLTNSGQKAACVIVDKVVESPAFINIEVSEQTESLVYGELYEIAESDMPWPLEFVQHLTEKLDIEEKAKVDHRYFNLLELFEAKQYETEAKIKQLEDDRRNGIQKHHLEQIDALHQTLKTHGDAAASAQLTGLLNHESMSDPVTASIFRQEIITAIYDLDSNAETNNLWPSKLMATIAAHYDFLNPSESLEPYSQYIEYCQTRQRDYEFYIAQQNQLKINDSGDDAVAWQLLVNTDSNLPDTQTLAKREKRALRAVVKLIDAQAPSLWDHELKRPGGTNGLYALAGVSRPRKELSERLDLLLGSSILATVCIPVLVIVFNVFLSADTTRSFWQDTLFVINKSLYGCAGVASLCTIAYVYLRFVDPFFVRVRREVNHSAGNRLAAHMVFFTATLGLFLWQGDASVATTLMLVAAALMMFFRYNLRYVASLAVASVAAHALTFPLMLEYFSRLSLINMYALHLIGIQLCMLALIQLAGRWTWLANRFDSAQPELGQWCSALAISVACCVSVMLPAIH